MSNWFVLMACYSIWFDSNEFSIEDQEIQGFTTIDFHTPKLQTFKRLRVPFWGSLAPHSRLFFFQKASPDGVFTRVGFDVFPLCSQKLRLLQIEEPSVLVRLACSRHGHGAAREVLQVLEGSDRTKGWRDVGPRGLHILTHTHISHTHIYMYIYILHIISKYLVISYR